MTTGLFARTPTDDAHDTTKLDYIVMVSRNRPELLDEMTRRFEDSPDTLVVSERHGTSADSECRRVIDAHLSSAGYVIFRSA